VSSRRAPAVPVATVPGQVVIWMVWCAPAAGPGERSRSCRWSPPRWRELASWSPAMRIRCTS